MQCLIVDDDPLICDLVEHFCTKVEDIRSVTTTNSGFESINLINNHKFDIIFLDYNLPDITGKEILEVIPKDSAVVMITSNRDFGSDSYNYDQVVDFIVKPLEFPRFFQSINKATLRLKKGVEDKSRLFIKDGNKLVKIELDSVLFFKSEANYISVVLSDRKILTLMALKELELKLPDFFQRIHRSYIVNLNKIDAIEHNVVTINDRTIPVSQSYEKELLRKINLLN